MKVAKANVCVCVSLFKCVFVWVCDTVTNCVGNNRKARPRLQRPKVVQVQTQKAEQTRVQSPFESCYLSSKCVNMEQLNVCVSVGECVSVCLTMSFVRGSRKIPFPSTLPPDVIVRYICQFTL